MPLITSYNALKDLADKKRDQFGVKTVTLNLTKVREIYRSEGIAIDLWALSQRVRAVYMCEDGEPSVLVNRRLPTVPRIFALVHELKHHYVDREGLAAGGIRCGDYNANRAIEIGAEVFAAQFIFPETEFRDCVAQMGLRRGSVTPEQLVRFKRTFEAPVSYRFLQKRFEFLGLIAKGSFAEVQFQKLEEKLFGVPFYKQPWYQARRRRRASGQKRPGARNG